MKKLILLFVLFFSHSFTEAQNVFIYDELGNKIYFSEKDNITLVSLDMSLGVSSREVIKSKLYSTTKTLEEISPVSYKTILTATQKQTICSVLGKDTSKIYFSKQLMYKDSTILWASNQIFVQIFPKSNVSDVLKEYAIPHTSFIQFGSNSQTYLITLKGIKIKQ